LLQSATGPSNSSVNFEILHNTASAAEVLFQWGTAVTAGFALNNTTDGNIAFFVNGLQLGSPTGGDKGVDTVNTSSGYYQNGAAGVTCGGLNGKPMHDVGK
jgi:hypothetical protein